MLDDLPQLHFPFAGTMKSLRVKDFTLARCTPGRSLACWLMMVIIALNASFAWAEDEILVGHSAAGQLKVEVGFDQPLGLEVSVFPGISGYATGEVGFHSAPFDEPINDFFQ